MIYVLRTLWVAICIRSNGRLESLGDYCTILKYIMPSLFLCLNAGICNMPLRGKYLFFNPEAMPPKIAYFYRYSFIERIVFI